MHISSPLLILICGILFIWHGRHAHRIIRQTRRAEAIRRRLDEREWKVRP